MASERRAWVRIPTSILREPWDYRSKCTVVLLQLHMLDRWARDKLTAEQACTVHLSYGDQLNLTGYKNVGYARRHLTSLEDLLNISTRSYGDVFEITWPKFAEFHNLAARSSGNTCRDLPPTSTSKIKKSMKEEKTMTKRGPPRGVESCWAGGARQAEKHGRNWNTLNGSRVKKIEAFLANHNGEDPGELGQRVVEGWVTLFSDMENCFRNLTPDVVFKPEHADRCLEAAPALGAPVMTEKERKANERQIDEAEMAAAKAKVAARKKRRTKEESDASQLGR